MKRWLFAAALLSLAVPLSAYAQISGPDNSTPDQVEIVKAQAVSVSSTTESTLPGTTLSQEYQTISALVLEGADAGQTITLDNDYLMLKSGDLFYARHEWNTQAGTDLWSVFEPYRLPTLWFVFGVFLVCLVLFGGWQGLRGLLALAASLFFIGYVLLPGVLAGYSPVLLAAGISSLIIIVGSYVTHGFNRATSAAVIGMLLTVILTGMLAYLTVHWGRFSGYTSEEASLLNIQTSGSIDFVGLLLGSLMIGLLGVLYDAAIGQAVAIEELAHAAAHYGPRQLFARGLRIGREHIGALVNTLAIAYVGAALPLLLYVKLTYTQSIWVTLNSEIFATEIVRTLIGSIGLILAVPITTAVAVYMLHGRSRAGIAHSAHHH